VEPLVLGKPALAFYQAATDILGQPAEHIVMIGDDIRGDIDGAQQAGLKAVLVRTGKFRDSDLELGIQPDAVLDSVVELPEWYQSHIGH
jgi:ribonucleotide monophosphatase NagD (HAD superfamily)